MLDNTNLFLIINFVYGAGHSLITPLFPTLAQKYNLSESVLGWIMGIFPLTVSIFTAIIPILCKKFSRIYLLQFSAFIEAIITILYGFLIFIPNKTLLMIIIFPLRIINGCCSAVISTLVYSLTISLAEKEKTQNDLSKLEIAWALGSSSGLLISSVFYKIGGYPLPFFVTGIFIFISSYLSLRINDKSIKKDNDENNDKNDNNNYLKYLLNPEVYLILIGFIVSLICVGFYSPSLTNHLNNNYSISVSISSLIFMAPTIPYIILLHYLDKITSKFGNYITFTFGVFALSISSFMIYPVPPIPQFLIFIIIGFLISGIGCVPVFTPGLVMLSNNIKKVDKSIDEMSSNDIASVLNNLVGALGDFIGPILGGYITEKFGFKFCCFIVSVFGLIYTGIFILMFYSKIKNDLSNIIQYKKLESDEEHGE